MLVIPSPYIAGLAVARAIGWLALIPVVIVASRAAARRVEAWRTTTQRRLADRMRVLDLDAAESEWDAHLTEHGTACVHATCAEYARRRDAWLEAHRALFAARKA